MGHKAKSQMSNRRILNVGETFKCSKCFNIQMSLLKVKYKSKQTWGSILHSSDWDDQNSSDSTSWPACKARGTFLLCCWDVQTCTTTLENNLAVSLRTRNDSTSRLSHTTPGYITKRCTPISQNIVQLCL